ncbi:TolC family protein [Paucibacter sp. APW11]|uniref:TolC family protein n=1 Tax=Roseateles aquae TaxID=3077235 RepID=A0ABU3PBR2_9BURK|nr:TolC family protein [Paucibacter sp. APW11]MDT8999705.1 TolC family protein [Paucibacter sp. APW11]
MRKLLLPLGLAAACLSPVPLWAQTTLTLELALEQATSRSPAIAAAAKEVDAAGAAVGQAAAWRNPELGMTVEDTRRESRTTTVTVDIPLELGGKRAARVTAAERAVSVAAAELSKVRAEVRSGVINAFFGVLVAQERMKLAESSTDIAARAADAVGKRVAAGKVSPVEATRARVDFANAQLELAEARSEWQTARFMLATLIGDGAPSFDTVQGDARTLPSRPAFSELVSQLENSPALLIGRLEAERRAALVNVEKSKASPDLTLSLGAKRDASAGRMQAVLGFSIPLPFFDRNQGAILEASRRADKAQDELQLARLRMLGELQDASNRLTVASASLQTLQGMVLPSAQEAYETASKGFDAGKFGFLDVIDAQRSLLQARSRYLNTLATAYQAAATIDRITGR